MRTAAGRLETWIAAPLPYVAQRWRRFERFADRSEVPGGSHTHRPVMAAAGSTPTSAGGQRPRQERGTGRRAAPCLHPAPRLGPARPPSGATPAPIARACPGAHTYLKPLEDSCSAGDRKLPAAQLTRMSSRPQRCTAAATMRSQSSNLRTSPCRAAGAWREAGGTHGAVHVWPLVQRRGRRQGGGGGQEPCWPGRHAPTATWAGAAAGRLLVCLPGWSRGPSSVNAAALCNALTELSQQSQRHRPAPFPPGSHTSAAWRGAGHPPTLTPVQSAP